MANHDSDRDSVSTASCSDDDEIDAKAFKAMNCNFLQKKKSGKFEEILIQRKQSVKNLMIAQQALGAAKKSLGNMFARRKEEGSGGRDEKAISDKIPAPPPPRADGSPPPSTSARPQPQGSSTPETTPPPPPERRNTLPSEHAEDKSGNHSKRQRTVRIGDESDNAHDNSNVDCGSKGHVEEWLRQAQENRAVSPSDAPSRTESVISLPPADAAGVSWGNAATLVAEALVDMPAPPEVLSIAVDEGCESRDGESSKKTPPDKIGSAVPAVSFAPVTLKSAMFSQLLTTDMLTKTPEVTISPSLRKKSLSSISPSSPRQEKKSLEAADDEKYEVKVTPLPKVSAEDVINVWSKAAFGLGGLLNLARPKPPVAADIIVEPPTVLKAVETMEATAWSKSPFLSAAAHPSVKPDANEIIHGQVHEDEGGDNCHADHSHDDEGNTSRETVIKKEKLLQQRVKMLKNLVGGGPPISLSARGPSHSPRPMPMLSLTPR